MVKFFGVSIDANRYVGTTEYSSTNELFCSLFGAGCHMGYVDRRNIKTAIKMISSSNNTSATHSSLVISLAQRIHQLSDDLLRAIEIPKSIPIGSVGLLGY